ncbi:MAG: bifunctional diaminohydroxyphosphoribosylaminopyrimidine deaminase/5-amino-6-(5-phosphoribosylamino)uracil reductase RibD [Alloprevotella sp.]|nr:bifunctional diaminohydroxyphosphoribosylaminopyrimidine deaminase/5-amino-6-(5-phosphoribosylamino)uracil reductase RibD [Alloprevotella sp.]
MSANHNQQSQRDIFYMRRCLQLARCGELGAPPNPMVGAVIVYDDRILGEGYHIKCGEAHAEVNAVRSVKDKDLPLLPQSTIYVSLEPCSHYGKTPPCAQLLVRTGFKRVVIGCLDPFARVSGRGVQMLQQAGIEVTVGVLEQECRELNRRFMTFNEKGRPFITLKWASSSDGYLDHWREDNAEGHIAEPAKLSTPETQVSVHHLRALHQAILVGHRTLQLDHPRLNIRHWSGNEPLKIVLGRINEDELPSGWHAYSDIDTLIVSLHKMGIQSLLVEGGAQTLQSFIDAGLWDEAQEEISAKSLGSGVPVPKMPRGVFHRVETHWGVTFNKWKND